MPVRLGVIGAGGIAGEHLSSLTSVANASVVAITDLDPEACRRRQERFQIPQIAPTDEALLAIDLDAVLVCTPTFTHRDMVVQAARTGKHIFCEKPMARTLTEADRMIEACERHGVGLMIGFVRRFCPEWGAFKSLVEQGLLGRPIVWRMVYASGGPSSPWYMDRAQGAGPFLDGMVHNYDFCRYAFGEAVDVRSTMVRLKPSTTALDTGTTTLTFESGDQHVIVGSWGLPAGCHSPGIHDALGPDGVLSFHDLDNDPGEVNTSTHGYFVIRRDGNTRQVYPFRKENMFVKEMQYFVDAVERGEKPKPDGVDGRKALEIALRVLGEM
ncbi:MAG: Gfo/Idh/MocA family oxidoreductase [Candidatus Latescibacteria bacterium]|nr:Gfo/Idh/MocA family oxidoreductase [Candidatus Latescibacterota bacterium]